MVWDVDAGRRSVLSRRPVFRSKSGRRAQRFTFAQLAAAVERQNRRVQSPAAVRSAHDEPWRWGRLLRHATCVDVEVDPDTGKVEILRYTASPGRGYGDSPRHTLRARCRAAVAQGIGWALNEEYFIRRIDGTMMNSTSFLDYRIPTCLRPSHDRHGNSRGAQ